MSNESKYCCIILVICGDHMSWKAKGHMNQFSSPERVMIENVTSKEFVVTWSGDTLINITDTNVASIINRIMIKIDEITKDPDPNMELRFKVINANGTPDLMDQIVFAKLNRARIILGSGVVDQ